jgi:hypothetical protein
VVWNLQQRSDEAQIEKKSKAVERMPSSKYYTYLVRFGEIYKEMMGSNYFPGVRDLNYIRNVVLALNEKKLGFDDYVTWIGQLYRYQLKKLGTISLRKYINEYLVNKSRSSL